jgi:surface antigen
MERSQRGLYAIALAVALLAAALWHIGSQLPELNRNLSGISRSADAATQELPAMIAVADKYEPHIPLLLDEIAATRATVDSIVTESQAYRTQLPDLYQRLDKLDAQLTSLQNSLPDVMERVDSSLAESQAWRPISVDAVAEAENWRQEIPGYLDRSEALVAGARKAGAEASSGMVTGFFSGALSLPFKTLSNISKLADPRSLSARHLTEEDWMLVRQAAATLLAQPENLVAEWQSEATANRGTVRIIDSAKSASTECHVLLITNHFSVGGKETLEKQRICKGKDGRWALQ